MEHYVAVYPTTLEAREAETELLTAGVPAGAIRRYDTATTVTAHAKPERGFWSWLLGEDEEPYAADSPYDNYLQRGYAVLTVSIAELVPPTSTHVMDILHSHNPVEITPEPEPYATIAPASTPTRLDDPVPTSPEATALETPASTASVVPPATASPVEPRATTPGLEPAALDEAAVPAAPPVTEEAVIPLAREELKVGKRPVNLGTHVVHRYVVEKPVTQDVTLQGERVTVERRAPVTGGVAEPGQHFEEKTVEVHETGEEPVAQKSAHVAEEVVISREPVEHTETIRDTVRHEEVEVKRGGDPPDAP
jgi:uncharacterized protein (TIGR02271 family)